MRVIVNFFLNLPFGIRVAFWLFLLIFVLWRMLGIKICWILSGIPFLLKRIFRFFYLLVEIPIAILHEKFGSIYSKIDATLLVLGEKIDKAIDSWYVSWHYYKHISMGKNVLIFVLSIAFIAVPSYIKVDNQILKIGETIYLRYETFLVNWMEKHEWYNPVEVIRSEQEEQIESNTEVANIVEITFVVSGINSSLLVRDIPSTETGAILGRLHNNDRVIWNGQMVFSKVDNGEVEPWIKIITMDGIEGWSRLSYLHPEQYENMEFHMTK